jgi:nucleoside-diphosphate-sugar epimerase
LRRSSGRLYFGCMTVVILGCGYTGERVARRMVERGANVICTSRDAARLSHLHSVQLVSLDVSEPFSLDFVPADSLVLHSIPPLENEDPRAIVTALEGRAKRLVYLSTTGVYGNQRDVSSSTAAAPQHEREWQRLRVEEAVLTSGISSIVLRPAAIYGQERGVHVSIAEGRYRLVGDGENFVSRIHVEDLAAHVEAAWMSDISGAWPVADERPCTSREIARYCSDMLGVPLPESTPPDGVHHTRRADRRVDGSAIRTALGIQLRYPTYREGLRARSKNS